MIKKRTFAKRKKSILGRPLFKGDESKLWEELKFPEGYWYEDAIIGAVNFSNGE